MDRHDESQRCSKGADRALLEIERFAHVGQLRNLGEGQGTVEIAHGNSLIEAPFVSGEGNGFHRSKERKRAALN